MFCLLQYNPSKKREREREKTSPLSLPLKPSHLFRVRLKKTLQKKGHLFENITYTMGGENNNNNINKKNKRYAVLMCAEDSEYVKKKYGGFYGVFLEMLGEEGESWEVYKVACGEFPEEEEVGEFDGFVITGSCNDAHGNDAWICRLLVLLKRLDSLKKKVLGICFGHQILSRALGGKTGPSKTGWDIGFREIKLSPSFKLFNSLKLSSTLSLLQCHRDEVRELPPKAEVIAWSDKTGIEMFRYGEHMMGIQGHPEYNKDILLHLLDRLLQRNLILESVADDVRVKLEGQEADKEAWQKLCISFFKGRL